MSAPVIHQTIIGDRNIVSGTGDIRIVYNLPPGAAEERYSLTILRNRVKQFWIDGVLEHSLQNAFALSIDKKEMADVVEFGLHRWEKVLELPDQPALTLSADKKTSEVFDEVDRSLLILGEPGSGKTVALLELARDLFSRAENDPTQPIPVVFNLSTWSQKWQSLSQWLVEEMRTKYFIPARTAKSWIEKNYVLLLLDGLDETRPQDRIACIESINQFCEQFGLSGLVVCSRQQEYLAASTRLRLNAAIGLQPLTSQQINLYLDNSGERLNALRVTLVHDDTLRDLARTPLMLSVMSLAYEYVSPESLSIGARESVDDRRHRIFDRYVERMFQRGGHKDVPYTKETTVSGLSWLAQKLQQHSQTIFLVEQLQPSWLTIPIELWIYLLVSRCFGAFILAFIWGEALSFGAFWCGVLGLIIGLVAAVIDGVRFGILRKFPQLQTLASKWHTLANILAYVFIWEGIGASLVLFFRVFDFYTTHQLRYESEQWSFFLFGLVLGVLVGLASSLFFGMRGARRHLRNDIRTAEALRWSFIGFFKGAGIGSIFGAVGGIAILLFYATVSGLNHRADPVLHDPLYALVVVALGGSVPGALIGAICGAFKSGVVEMKTKPNQGIRLSIRKSLIGGLIVTVYCSLVLGLFIWTFYTSGEALTWGPVFGVLIGATWALWYGGMDVIQHYALRFLLWGSEYTPRSDVRFLDYATSLIFLQKVGGGYIFIHRLILDYFAGLDAKPKSTSSASF